MTMPIFFCVYVCTCIYMYVCVCILVIVMLRVEKRGVTNENEGLMGNKHRYTRMCAEQQLPVETQIVGTIPGTLVEEHVHTVGLCSMKG